MTPKQYISQFYEKVIMSLNFDIEYINDANSILTRVCRIYQKDTRILCNPNNNIPNIIGYDKYNNIRIKIWYLRKSNNYENPIISIYNKYGNKIFDAFYNVQLSFIIHNKNIISACDAELIINNFEYILLDGDIYKNHTINYLCDTIETYYDKN